MASPAGAPGLYHPRAYDTGEPVPTWWRESAGPPPHFGALNGDADVDTAIIGGGITGLSAALHLARDHAIKPVVLEAGEIGWGASGRNGGFCVAGGAKRSPAAIVRDHGADQAAAFDRLAHGAVHRVARILEDEAIDAEVQPGGETLFAHSRRMFDLLRQDAAKGAQVLTPDDLRAHGMNAAYHGAVREPAGFGLHPLRYVRGLAAAATRHGAVVHPSTPVVRWERDGTRHILATPRGTVRSAKLIVAAGAYQPETLSPELAGRVLPVQSNILVTRPLTEAERQAQGWTSTAVAFDSFELLHYFRLLPGNRFLFGGRGGLSASPGAAAAFRARLTRDFHRRFPAWRDVAISHFWSGLVDLSADLLPHCAALDETTFHACAYHGNGVALGTEMGAQLALLATAGSAPALPGFMRRPPPRFVLPSLRKAYLAGALSFYALKDAVS
jgi:glycine/D-amino acid oxidase-like deaminating enzyme